MSHTVNLMLKFDDLVEKYDEVLKYACKHSDSFSVISRMRKPYSKTLPRYECQEAMEPLQPYFIRYVPEIKKWPGTESKEKHVIMILFRSCKECRIVMQGMPNFLTSDELPEDLTFYRGEKPWLVTIPHEQMSYMIDVTEEDIEFVKSIGMTILRT